MRLISLNCWGGRALYPLMRFFTHHASSTDIFCLQEIFDTDQEALDRSHPGEYLCASLFPKLSAVLPEFVGAFAKFDDNPQRQTLAMFVHRRVPVRVIEDFVVHQPDQPQEAGSAVHSARKLQYATVDLDGHDFTVANFHGLWNGGGKTDTPERLRQSAEVKRFLDARPGPRLLCGDFNLLPDTESVAVLEQGMRNLVKEYRLTSTRTPLYRNYQQPGASLFADYVLVSPEVQIQKFAVLPDLVSDHAALVTEFSL